MVVVPFGSLHPQPGRQSYSSAAECHCLSSHREAEGTVNLDCDMGWIQASLGALAMSPQQAGGLRELAVLLLCFLSRLWGLC